MTPSRRISIVIPARNEAAGLRQLLPGLVSLALDAEILVVDDGSTDERKTLDELLAGLGMLESKPASEKTEQ